MPPQNSAVLDDLIQSSAEVAEGQRDFMAPQSSVRKKRGRPTKEEAAEKAASAEANEPTEPPPPVIDTKPACEMAFNLASSYLVRTTGEKRMALMPEEIDALATVWGKVLDKHLPAILGEYALEIAALAVTGQVATRIYSVASILVAEKQAARARHMPAQSQSQEYQPAQATEHAAVN